MIEKEKSEKKEREEKKKKKRKNVCVFYESINKMARRLGSFRLGFVQEVAGREERRGRR